jgi:succinoglycan biosynthesis protein ExoM
MSAMRITIAIITYQRPESLRSALAAISSIIVPKSTEICILVVDNDRSQSANVVVEAADWLPFSTRYVVEPQKGRGFARNRALDETIDQDYIAFIDDDVFISADWLSAVLKCCVLNQAQFCSGNLRYLYPDNAPRWVKDCRLLQSRATGKQLISVATGNLLMDRQWIATHHLRYPLDVACEDIFFSHFAYRRGACIMTCIEAQATTRVESERLNIAWVFRRALRNGANRSMLYRHLYGRGGMLIFSCWRGGQMCFFASGAMFLACIQRRPWIRVVEHAGMALGYVAGMFGSSAVADAYSTKP